MRFILHLLALSTLTAILLACGGSPTPEATAEGTSTPAANTNARLDVAEGRVMPQDQTEGTAEANPEVVNPAHLPEPQLVEKTPETKPRQTPQTQTSLRTAAPPAPPAPPASQNNQTSSTATPPATSPAPATAPEIKVADEVVKFETESASPDIDHNAFNKLLEAYVNGSGKVNYDGLKKNEAKLDTYLAMLAEDAPDDNWNGNEALAYWLNAYNAFTLKLILKNYPVNKITDLHGGKPWDVKWIELDGKTYSLNNIEHDIIRPRYKDPRIHFAVVCAATSCPPLANYAFSASSVNSQLDKLARNFINNDKFNQTEGDVKVSRIFDWYAEDFGDVRAYLNKYLTTDIPAGAELGFIEYDWGLNKQ